LHVLNKFSQTEIWFKVFMITVNHFVQIDFFFSPKLIFTDIPMYLLKIKINYNRFISLKLAES